MESSFIYLNYTSTLTLTIVYEYLYNFDSKLLFKYLLKVFYQLFSPIEFVKFVASCRRRKYPIKLSKHLLNFLHSNKSKIELFITRLSKLVIILFRLNIRQMETKREIYPEFIHDNSIRSFYPLIPFLSFPVVFPISRIERQEFLLLVT